MQSIALRWYGWARAKGEPSTKYAARLACQGVATQRVVATTLQKVPEYEHKKTTALTVVFLVRPQGLEPWTHWLRVSCSTNWAKDAYPRDNYASRSLSLPKICRTCLATRSFAYAWSGRRDSDPRLSPWQGDTLPLSHSRKQQLLYQINRQNATIFR